MAATPYQSQVYTKIAELLTAWTPFQSQCASSFRWDQQMTTTPTPASLQDTAFPRWVLWPGTSVGIRMWDASPSFDENAIPYNQQSARIEQTIERYMLTIVGRTPYFQDVDQLVADAATAIRQGGPRLGLPFVRCIERIDAKRLWGMSPGTGGKERWEATLFIPVRFEFQGHDLLV